jgi:predicted nuclease of restriction endonuclease-like (RecB) superfamily
MALRSGAGKAGPANDRNQTPVRFARRLSDREDTIAPMARRNMPARRSETLPADYPQFLEEVKRAVSTARSQAAVAVSAAVLAAYWEIGTGIIAREDREGWGAKVIERLAADLRREFPDMRGLSARNLHYMREFARAWPAQSASEVLQQPAAKLPWGHHMVLLDRVADTDVPGSSRVRISASKATTPRASTASPRACVAATHRSHRSRIPSWQTATTARTFTARLRPAAPAGYRGSSARSAASSTHQHRSEHDEPTTPDRYKRSGAGRTGLCVEAPQPRLQRAWHPRDQELVHAQPSSGSIALHRSRRWYATVRRVVGALDGFTAACCRLSALNRSGKVGGLIA